MHAQYLSITDVDCAFYVDNGKVGCNNTNKVQTSLDLLTNLFKYLDLCMNVKKTKAMITKGQVNCIQQSTLAYLCHITGMGQTYQERNTSLTECPLCPAMIQRQSLPNHVRFSHPDETLLAKQLEKDKPLGEIMSD